MHAECPGSPTARPLGVAQLLFASLLCMYLFCGAWSPLLFASMFSAFRELGPQSVFFFLFFLSPPFYSPLAIHFADLAVQLLHRVALQSCHRQQR